MRHMLAGALRNAPANDDDADDVAVLRRLQKTQDRSRITQVVKSTTTVSRVLEEPQLPSRRDLARWWPEPVRETLNPLVSFPSPHSPADRRAAASKSPTTPSPTSPTGPTRVSLASGGLSTFSGSLTRSVLEAALVHVEQRYARNVDNNIVEG